MTVGVAHSTGVIKTATLTIAGGTGNKLDLTDNKLILTSASVGSVSGGTYSGVTGLIQSARNGGAWNGRGITTSLANAAEGLTALGVATAQDVGLAGGSLGGVSVSGTDVLVMYTYAGDADLNGKLDGDDYFRIDSNIHIAGAHGWRNGDFDYNAKIDGDDYFILDHNIGRQTLETFAATAGSGTGGVVVVPEPTGLVAIGTAVAASLIRRRRRVPSSRTTLALVQ
jgi:hypothetical protein